MLSSTKSRRAGVKSLQIFFFFFLTTQICFAQWYQQNSGTTLDLNDITFTNENKGFMFGGWVQGHGDNNWGEQTLFATSNGGSDWDTTLVIYYPHLYSSCYLQNDSVGFVIHENYTWSSVCALLKTTNFGDSWIDVTPDSGFIGGDISFQNDMTGWIAGDKIYKTTDSGNSWYVDYTDSLEDFFLNSISVTPTTVWAVGEGTILKYTSQTGWVKQTSVTDFWSHKVVFIDENNGWIAGLTPLMSGYPPILLRTNDGGVTWYSIPNVPSIEDFEFVDSNLGWGIGSDSTGVGGILRTTNGGETWEIEVGNLTSQLNALFIKNNYGWAVGDNGTILHTTNGGVPVELTSFTAKANGKEVTLNWSTATELNNQGFEVQRKFGSNDFVTIGSVKGNGTTTSPNQYTYVDKLSDAGKYFYRLKQIDFGGKYEYSQTVEVNWSPFTTYKLEQNYPNPFNPTTTIGFGIASRKRKCKII